MVQFSGVRPPPDLKNVANDVNGILQMFIKECEPLETEVIYVMMDAHTNARYCEFHIRANKLLSLGTVDVPLDPEDQPDYRANREMVEDHAAYERMKADANDRRTFSNIVTEFTDSFDPDHPLKIIGGQHRFNAIKHAYQNGIDEYHGIKVYFGLNPDQRFDVQLISNLNIDVSLDLIDRMYETLAGPQLRDWCQEVGLLEKGQDFISKRQKGKPITVRDARTFILNFYKGKQVPSKDFNNTKTIPILPKSGVIEPEWDKLKNDLQYLWTNPGLKKAGQEFALLVPFPKS